MSLTNIFDIAGSGMAVQSIRLNTTASNIANADSASSSTDDVYRARKPVFSAIQQDVMSQALGGQSGDMAGGVSASQGVQIEGIIESDAPLNMRFEPDHPMANDKGYVMYPNVNVVEEMADMLSASRSFQTNVSVMDSANTMLHRLLTLVQ